MCVCVVFFSEAKQDEIRKEAKIGSYIASMAQSVINGQPSFPLLSPASCALSHNILRSIGMMQAKKRRFLPPPILSCIASPLLLLILG